MSMLKRPLAVTLRCLSREVRVPPARWGWSAHGAGWCGGWGAGGCRWPCRVPGSAWAAGNTRQGRPTRSQHRPHQTKRSTRLTVVVACCVHKDVWVGVGDLGQVQHLKGQQGQRVSALGSDACGCPGGLHPAVKGVAVRHTRPDIPASHTAGRGRYPLLSSAAQRSTPGWTRRQAGWRVAAPQTPAGTRRRPAGPAPLHPRCPHSRPRFPPTAAACIMQWRAGRQGISLTGLRRLAQHVSAQRKTGVPRWRHACSCRCAHRIWLRRYPAR